MLPGAIYADDYWTERIMRLPELTLYILLRAMLEGDTNVGWIGGLQMGTLPHHDVVARADEVRSAPLSRLYWRADKAIKDKEFWAYYTEEGALATA